MVVCWNILMETTGRGPSVWEGDRFCLEEPTVMCVGNSIPCAPSGKKSHGWNIHRTDFEHVKSWQSWEIMGKSAQRFVQFRS